MNIDGLKPCPFCGGEPYLQYFDGIYDYGPQEPTYCVECLDCGGEGPTCESGEEAIEAWNRRGGS